MKTWFDDVQGYYYYHHMGGDRNTCDLYRSSPHFQGTETSQTPSSLHTNSIISTHKLIAASQTLPLDRNTRDLYCFFSHFQGDEIPRIPSSQHHELFFNITNSTTRPKNSLPLPFTLNLAHEVFLSLSLCTLFVSPPNRSLSRLCASARAFSIPFSIYLCVFGFLTHAHTHTHTQTLSLSVSLCLSLSFRSTTSPLLTQLSSQRNSTCLCSWWIASSAGNPISLTPPTPRRAPWWETLDLCAQPAGKGRPFPALVGFLQWNVAMPRSLHL